MTVARSKAGGKSKGITKQEIEDVEEMSSPRTPVIYEVVRRLGDEEMRRPVTSLWWSGLAAGLSISFSLLGQAIIESRLPDAAWRPLVSGFGYSVGFLMVVLGRQQLFTESTITVVLPVFADLSWSSVWRICARTCARRSCAMNSRKRIDFAKSRGASLDCNPSGAKAPDFTGCFWHDLSRALIAEPFMGPALEVVS